MNNKGELAINASSPFLLVRNKVTDEDYKKLKEYRAWHKKLVDAGLWEVCCV